MNKIELTKLLERAFKSGPLQRVPKKPNEAEALLALSIAGLDANSFYDEKEIDAHLKGWLTDISAPEGNADHVTWRRALVDYRFFRRATDGVIYRVEAHRIDEALDMDARDVDPQKLYAEALAAKRERQQKYGH